MKDSILYTQKGYYTPSFLQMKVDANCDLTNLNSIAPAHYSTFLHEYVHFLQDMGSTFGLVNANIVGNRLMHYVKDVETNYGTTFPVSLPISPGHLIQVNKDMQQVYMGQGKIISGPMPPSAVTINSVSWVKTATLLPAPYNKFLNEVEVDFTFDANTHKYKLGAIGLMETMANFIQKKHFPSTSAPAIPYNSAQLVAQKIYPIIGNNSEFVFALCDICLLDYHPGRTFYHTLELMAMRSYIPTVAEDIYTFVKTEVKGEKGESLDDIFEQVSKKAEDLYSSVFSSPVFVNEQRWLKEVVISARNLRLSSPTFMLNLYRQSAAKSPALINLLNELGTPLMFNRNEQAFFIPPRTLNTLQIMPDRLAAILEMFLLFDAANKHCRLIDYCGQAIITDGRCTSEPWTRSTDPDLCAYGQFWKTWNLIGKSPL